MDGVAFHLKACGHNWGGSPECATTPKCLGVLATRGKGSCLVYLCPDPIQLHYCNGLYVGLSLKMVWKLQLVRNGADFVDRN